MKYEIIFESERIIFTKLYKELANEYIEMVNDVEVQRFIGHNRDKITLEKEIEWINSKLEEKANVFTMIEKDTNEFIGTIEIMNIKDNIGEMGIAITRNKQNNHFGQEAIRRLIKYAFNDLKLNALELNVYNFNPRGIACYKKCGFEMDRPGKTEEEYHMIIKKENYYEQ
jgi:RimJ/RimL family protein N-acetyltransferase